MTRLLVLVQSLGVNGRSHVRIPFAHIRQVAGPYATIPASQTQALDRRSRWRHSSEPIESRPPSRSWNAADARPG